MVHRQLHFIRQQGFESANEQTCAVQYRALQFQPRVIGLLVLVGGVLQSPILFLALSAVLWWNVLVPRRNPFDRMYDRLVGTRRGHPPAAPAPPPRRFAQGLAATLMLTVSVGLLAGPFIVAAVGEGILLAAIAAIVLRGFCLGSFIFHRLQPIWVAWPPSAGPRRRDVQK
jgi:hypothetical protein